MTNYSQSTLYVDCCQLVVSICIDSILSGLVIQQQLRMQYKFMDYYQLFLVFLSSSLINQEEFLICYFPKIISGTVRRLKNISCAFLFCFERATIFGTVSLSLDRRQGRYYFSKMHLRRLLNDEQCWIPCNGVNTLTMQKSLFTYSRGRV